jgi:TRAP-type C4-dicarboxylate transport system substrate-binding protein
MARSKKLGIGVIILLVSFFIAMVPNNGETAERQTIKLRVVAGHPNTVGTYWVKSLEEFFCRESEKRVLSNTKDYKLELTGHYGGTLAKIPEVFEFVENGLADIGFIMPLFEMSKLEPFNFSMWIPFTPPALPPVIRAAQKTYNQFPLFNEVLAKYKQVRIGSGLSVQPSYQLITKFPVKTKEDLKGKKMGHGGPMLPWLSALGATSVQMSYPDVYTSMDTGVLNGYAMPVNIVVGYKIYDVGKYLTKVDLAGTTANNGLLTANLTSWKKIPKEVRDILEEVSTEYTYDMAKRAEAAELNGVAILKNANVATYTLPKEEKARWAKALDDARVTAKVVAACKAHGFPAEEIATFYIKALEEEGYKFPYPVTIK